MIWCYNIGCKYISTKLAKDKDGLFGECKYSYIKQGEVIINRDGKCEVKDGDERKIQNRT